MTHCPICQKPLIPFLVSSNLKILKCQGCGFGVTQALKAQQGQYHRDETYIQEETLFRNIFQKRVDILMKVVNPKSVLEVGCSTGLMLALFKEKGVQISGVEMSKKTAQVAKERGINIVVGDFLKSKIDQKFDLVVFNHTLEHVADLELFIKKSAKLILTGGFLYIDLPNFGSLSSKILKSYWPLFLPDEHLWHFTYRSLEILLQKNGFKPVFSEKASGIWDYKFPFYGLWLSLSNFKKRFFMELITAIPSLVTSKLQIGSDLMVIAKKV